MRAVGIVQDWLRGSELAGVIIPSADEYISEFSPPANRRLKWVTGFRGSTGMAVVLRDTGAMFLDSRYLLQGMEDSEGTGLAVEPSSIAARRAWLSASLGKGVPIGIDPKLHPMADLKQWQTLAADLDFELELLSEHPVDHLWAHERPAAHRPLIIDYPIKYAGEPYESKCAGLVSHVQDARLAALLVADPEDVSWLLNVRAADEALGTEVGDWHVVPYCASRALVRRDGSITWFVGADVLSPEIIARGQDIVAIAPPEALAAMLRDAAREGPIGADPRRTPASLAMLVGQEGEVRDDDTVARRRWRKHPAEIAGAKHAHITDAAAVVTFMAWLDRTAPERTIYEFEAAEKLEALRAANPAYKGASMPLMSASGPSAAQPHYVPRQHVDRTLNDQPSRRLNDHPIYWMDSGGHYLGGTTDNTVALAIGKPEPKHILAHTLVLKGFLALGMARFPVGTAGLHLDPLARQALWQEGMDYGHGTGHGVGNYLNIHEGPSIGREPNPISTVPIEPGNILSNEPAYYVQDDFGVRVESHMLAIESAYPGYLEFETISRLPIDPRLVDFDRLSQSERKWLADYHRIVLKDLDPLVDPETRDWLANIVQAFANAASPDGAAKITARADQQSEPALAK